MDAPIEKERMTFVEVLISAIEGCIETGTPAQFNLVNEGRSPVVVHIFQTQEAVDAPKIH